MNDNNNINYITKHQTFPRNTIDTKPNNAFPHKKQFELLFNNVLSTNEEIKQNDRPLIFTNTISPSLRETLYNKPSTMKNLIKGNNTEKKENVNNLRISLKNTQPQFNYKRKLFSDGNIDTEEKIKNNGENFTLLENVNKEEKIKDNEGNLTLPEKINKEENEIILKDLDHDNDIDNDIDDDDIDIEQNNDNINKEDLNEKIKEIKRTVSELKLLNYDSNSTNDVAIKSPIFSEEELNKEIDKVNEKVNKYFPNNSLLYIFHFY